MSKSTIKAQCHNEGNCVRGKAYGVMRALNLLFGDQSPGERSVRERTKKRYLQINSYQHKNIYGDKK